MKGKEKTVASVDEFLDQNPNLMSDNASLGAELADLKLEVVILDISPHVIEFRYMGTDYRIDRIDVLELEDPQDSSSTGKVTTLKLKRDAVLLAKYSVSARHLDSTLPFTLASRQPTAPYDRTVPSPREIAWRRMTGYDPGAITFGEGAVNTTASESVSGGIVDDSIADD
jgi:hypothetical protein